LIARDCAGRRSGAVSPEDFIVLKLLATRERDLEDAAQVLAALEDRLDLALVEREIVTLAEEIPDWDVAGRWHALGRG
jgi:hypothetical protein